MSRAHNGTTVETLSLIPIVRSDFGLDTPSEPGITVGDNRLLEASIISTRPK